jgi:sulfur transfer complex TusBCD TusB component (DsrH family)
MKGYWSSLIALLDDLEARGMTRRPWRTYIKVASSLDELTKIISEG